MSKPRVKCCSVIADEGPHVALLQAAGFDVERADRSLNYARPEDLIQDLQGCAATIAGAEAYPREVIEALPDLRVIARTGVGFDAVDLAACDEKSIVVATTPGVNHHAVAEHAIAMLLAVARGFPDLDQDVRAGKWRRGPTPRVMGSTLGLLGLGRIGQAVATRGVGLGMKVIACEPNPDMDFIENWNIDLVEFEDLLGESDFLSLHSPLTPQTHHMMNVLAFSKMKSGAVFINTARGGLVDEAALCDALRTYRLRGAALDVFEAEPLPIDSPLLSLPHVLLSSHVAGMDFESIRDTLTMAAQAIIDLHQGAWPGDCIQNLKQVDGWTWARAGH